MFYGVILKRVLLTLLGLALMFGQSSGPTGMIGAAATSSSNQTSPYGIYDSSPSSKAEAQNILAIGAVVAGVAAASGN